MLQEWQNPYLNETVKVVHVDNDPFNYMIEDFFPTPPKFGLSRHVAIGFAEQRERQAGHRVRRRERRALSELTRLRRQWFAGLPRDGEVFTFQGSDLADARSVLELADQGRLRVDVEPFSLDDVGGAYEALHDGTLLGRAVVQP